jgi:DNA (cytosine-5)-methyltransferase 1
MNFYNEFDSKAAAWLRELIKDGLIPGGVVDERSIVDLKPSDLAGFTQCHFFAGIGGWSYALRLAGWPDDEPVWTGSCPCQPFSCAGKQMGNADPRHLWPAFRRLINKCRPPVVFGEQVASKDGRMWLSGVRSNLETMGYAVRAADLCSAGVGSPNIRQRLYWVGDATVNGSGALNRQSGSGAGQESSFGGPSVYGGLANTNGRDACPEREQRGREHGLEPEDRGAGGLDYANGPRREPPGVGAEAETRDGARMRGPESGCSHGGLGDTGSQGLPQRIGDSRIQREAMEPPPGKAIERGGNHGPWGDTRNILCLDHKTRRIPVEPRLFPLAAGVPGRVGLLRGAGNAINVEVAKAFIEACKTVRT